MHAQTGRFDDHNVLTVRRERPTRTKEVGETTKSIRAVGRQSWTGKGVVFLPGVKLASQNAGLISASKHNYRVNPRRTLVLRYETDQPFLGS
jgi:hypothetical protein